MFTFENLIDYFILTIMSDTGTDSDCTICVTNNGDFANDFIVFYSAKYIMI